MKIRPVTTKINGNKKINKQTQFESKDNVILKTRLNHNYTGIASVDLAYASMFDNSIAKDLKLMGLI